MKIGFLRGAGIGDLVMVLPIIRHAMAMGHRCIVITRTPHFGWLKRVLPGAELADWYSGSVAGWKMLVSKLDYICNFDCLQEIDADARRLHFPPIPWVVMALVIVRQIGLPAPDNLSPSGLYPSRQRNGPGLIFTCSNHPSRHLSSAIAGQLAERWPDSRIDPKFSSELDLCEAIAGSRFVIGPDTGVIHLADLCAVPWLCFCTTIGGQYRYGFYRHGRYLNPDLACAPCGGHGGCGKPVCAEHYDPAALADALTWLDTQITLPITA
jgi:hypothetical protein